METKEGQKDHFLESIADEYKIFGSHREIFLERYSYQNKICQNKDIAERLGKQEKDLQDALTAIHKLIENKEPSLKGKLLKKGRGRPAKGEEPWAKLSEFLWEQKFSNYCNNINQEKTEYQKLTVKHFRRMLEDKIKKLTANSLLDGLYFDTESLYIPLRLVERKQKPRHGDIKPEHGSAFYRLNNDEIIRKFTHDQFLNEVLNNENSSKSQGKRLAIIGEPGSGKTTRLQQIARWLFEQNTDNRVIWVSLAELREKTLEDYLLTDWLRDTHKQRKVSEAQQDELVEEFNRGNVWLLLDGIDEMGSSGLSLFDKLPAWIKSAKIIVTCRLNVWDGSPRALSDFDVYYNDDFDDEQQQQFAINFLKNENYSQSLLKALNQPGKERIKDLVKNPLRLTLLCHWWQENQGSLPDTKAELYEKFVEVYYRWKKISISDSKKKELEKALGRLAIQGLNRDQFHFRFTKKQINEVLGEADEGVFKLALDLGWLNEVGLSEENSEKIYAFFHPSFQEYFAALAIDSWSFFMNDTIIEKYLRIFEKKWEESILIYTNFAEMEKTNKIIYALLNFTDDFKIWSNKLFGFYEFKALLIGLKISSEIKSIELAELFLRKIFTTIKPLGFFSNKISKLIRDDKKVDDLVLLGCWADDLVYSTLNDHNKDFFIEILKDNCQSSNESLILLNSHYYYSRLNQKVSHNQDGLFEDSFYSFVYIFNERHEIKINIDEFIINDLYNKKTIKKEKFFFHLVQILKNSFLMRGISSRDIGMCCNIVSFIERECRMKTIAQALVNILDHQKSNLEIFEALTNPSFILELISAILSICPDNNSVIQSSIFIVSHLEKKYLTLDPNKLFYHPDYSFQLLCRIK